MKKKEKVEHILQLLSRQDRKAFKSYLKSTNLKSFYELTLDSFTKNQGNIINLKLKKNNLDYSYNQLIESFYEFLLSKFSGKKLLEIRLNILAQYPENALTWEQQNSYAKYVKTPHSLEDYHNSFKVNNLIYFSSLNETKESTQNTQSLQTAERHLDIYYAIQKLRLTLEKISRAYRLKTNDIPAHLKNQVGDLSIIDMNKHPILLLYHTLYDLICAYHQHNQVDKPLIEKIKQLINTPTLEQEHKEFAITSLINFFNTQRPKDFHLEIHQLYVIAHHQKLLFQQGQTIYFSDITNLISSSINCKDIHFLEIIQQQYIRHSNHQESLLYLYKAAILLLSKEWILLSKMLKMTAPLPPIGLRVYYLIHLHIIKIKAAIESYIEQMDYAYEVDFNTLINSYQKLINRNTEQEKLPRYFKIKKLAFKQQLEILVKTFAYTSKVRKRLAVEEWFQELPSDTLYFQWLKDIYKTILNKL